MAMVLGALAGLGVGLAYGWPLTLLLVGDIIEAKLPLRASRAVDLRDFLMVEGLTGRWPEVRLRGRGGGLVDIAASTRRTLPLRRAVGQRLIALGRGPRVGDDLVGWKFLGV